MSRIRRRTQDQPSVRQSPIEELVGWRTVMEGESLYGNIMTLMHARKGVGYYRDKLAPWERIPCPECGGRGTWVEEDGNHWCARFSGTGFLLAEELMDPTEMALVHKTAPPPDWGRLLSLEELAQANMARIRENVLEAIVGDIVGSVHGRRGSAVKTLDFLLFSDHLHWVDDTVLTMAAGEHPVSI